VGGRLLLGPPGLGAPAASGREPGLGGVSPSRGLGECFPYDLGGRLGLGECPDSMIAT